MLCYAVPPGNALSRYLFVSVHLHYVVSVLLRDIL